MSDLKKIISGLQGRWDRAKENRRLIDREKLMIDPSAIVLYTEFYDKVVAPAAKEQSAFRDVFHDGRGISSALYGMMSTGYAPVFPVPLEVVEDDEIKESYLSKLRMQLDMGHRMLDMFRSANANIIICGDLSDDPEKDFEKAKEEATIPGFYVYHLALAMDLHRTLLGGTGIQRYERNALWRDQGQDVVTFWKNVNGLKDYSGHFPDRKPPGGNRPDDRSGRSPVGELQPTF